jgi:hypothetical protein
MSSDDTSATANSGSVTQSSMAHLRTSFHRWEGRHGDSSCGGTVSSWYRLLRAEELLCPVARSHSPQSLSLSPSILLRGLDSSVNWFPSLHFSYPLQGADGKGLNSLPCQQALHCAQFYYQKGNK